MKKLFVLLFLLYASNLIFGQITYVKDVNDHPRKTIANEFVVFDGEDITIYDDKFNEIKSFPVLKPNIPKLSRLFLTASTYTSRNFYDSDNDYEYLLNATDSNHRNHYYVVNEDQSVLIDFDQYEDSLKTFVLLENTPYIYLTTLNGKVKIYKTNFNYSATRSDESNVYNQQITVFPNPASDFIRFNLMVAGNMQIISQKGEVVYDDVYTPEVQISHLPKGSYNIVIKAGTDIYTSQFLKQ